MVGIIVTSRVFDEGGLGLRDGEVSFAQGLMIVCHVQGLGWRPGMLVSLVGL